MTLKYYLVKYKAIKVGKEDTLARNKEEAIKNVKDRIHTHIQGDVKVNIIAIKEE